MIRNLLLIGLGGGLGSVARYFTNRLLSSTLFPWGTLTVNLVGSLVIGLCWGLVMKGLLTSDWRLFLITGICGGFTTFSAFSLESVHLIQENRVTLFMLYVTVSVVLCMLATIAGIKLIGILK